MIEDTSKDSSMHSIAAPIGTNRNCLFVVIFSLEQPLLPYFLITFYFTGHT